jgi:hypothetical protein
MPYYVQSRSTAVGRYIYKKKKLINLLLVTFFFRFFNLPNILEPLKTYLDTALVACTLDPRGSARVFAASLKIKSSAFVPHVVYGVRRKDGCSVHANRISSAELACRPTAGGQGKRTWNVSVRFPIKRKYKIKRKWKIRSRPKNNTVVKTASQHNTHKVRGCEQSSRSEYSLRRMFLRPSF